MEFKEYITSILYISIFAVILELFLPKTKIKKYISSIISLLIILAIVSPVFNVLKEEKVEQALDSAIFALSNIASATGNSNSFDFSEYKNKIIVSRVKLSLEQEMLQVFKEKAQDVANICSVDIELDEMYKIELGTNALI